MTTPAAPAAPAALVGLCGQRVARPALDLVVIPGAGGGPAYYGSWREFLPADWRVWGVCLPGRASRYHERPCRTLAEAADQVAEAVAAAGLRRPVLFGHSLGALLGLEVAAREDMALVLTAACAPPAPGTAIRTGDLDQEQTRRWVRAQLAARGIPDADLVAELEELTVPVLRADLAMLDGYVPPTTPLDCGIVSYYGAADDLPSASWARYTTAGAQVVEVPGDHDFPQHRPQPVLGDIVRRLASG